jgi:hypothetical protein
MLQGDWCVLPQIVPCQHVAGAALRSFGAMSRTCPSLLPDRYFDILPGRLEHGERHIA